MKITNLIRKTTFALTVILILFSACSGDKNKKDYLEKVLKNLDNIESATYYIKSENWAPGDTAVSGIYHNYIKEYNNPLGIVM